MAGMVSVQDAGRVAKDALGDVPAEDLAAWISKAFGMTFKAVLVTVFMGSFIEQERLRRAAVEMVTKANGEPPDDKPKKGRKSSEQEAGFPDAKERNTTGSGCLAW